MTGDDDNDDATLRGRFDDDDGRAVDRQLPCEGTGGVDARRKRDRADRAKGTDPPTNEPTDLPTNQLTN